ncbi:glycosyltransferase [Paenibacillus sp. J22TS3]|uniref:glycosyltransferase n=1 Tax=Paenibacillus sp. J22TS3 TaxID=2807192 RepID=UPI001BCD3FEE|nr:glycosyltransferase [Paenibacillus sp. J22TS3]
MQTDITCSVVVALTGDFFKVHRDLAATLLNYQNAPDEVEVIIVSDGAIWRSLPLLQMLGYKRNIRIIENQEQSNHFGILFNQGLKQATGKYITFLWPGIEYSINEIMIHCYALDQKEDLACIYTSTKDGIEQNYISSINYGWLQCANLISLAGAVFKVQNLIEINGFREELYFQRYTDWDIFLRLSKFGELQYKIDSKPLMKWELINYPYTNSAVVTQDEVHRNLLRNKKISSTKINITITGGYWEPTHNQLCFFNYFDTELGHELYSWKSLFDFSATEDDLIGSDLVIISRGRHQNVLNILNYCEKHNIPTLYMIDDNWFTVAEDWPVYKDIFSPGKPDYEVFIECLTRCNAVLVYSKVLEGYVTNYAKRVYRLDINIDLMQFEKTRSGSDSRKLVGYSGSPRFSDVAFEGLLKFIQQNDEWDLLIFGVQLPDKLKELRGSPRLKFINFTNYHKYARTIANLNPDILLAPLDNCVSSQSKCPNKFLEITAAGAVGIYTDILPYSEVVTNNENGILISESDQNNSDAWFEAINNLANNKQLRVDLHSNATSKVKEMYETEFAFQNFSALISQVIKEAVK